MTSFDLADLAQVDLADVDVVSLDVFDTCLGRAVLDPTDAFCLVPDRAGIDVRRWHRGGSDPRAWFRAERCRAERAARAAGSAPSTEGGSAPEVTLAAIYEQLTAVIGDGEVRQRLLSAELDVERSLSVARAETRAFAERVVASRRTLVYLSDMYLPAWFVRELLGRGRFPEGDVLVSCEAGASKAAGTAYPLVARRHDADVGRLLHVGDNFRVDGWAAYRAGVRSIVVDRGPLQLQRPWETHSVVVPVPLGDSVLLGLACNSAPTGRSARATAERIGTVALGPLQLAFTSWLRERTSRDDHLLFCSRDMRHVLDLYQHLEARRGSPTERCHYFHVSRRSVGLPAIATGITDADRELLVGGRGHVTAAELWGRIGLGDIGAGMPEPDRPLAIHEREMVWRSMIANQDAILARAREELEAFRTYWLQSGLPQSGDAVLIDVGWRATVQRALERCLAAAELPVQVRGLYVALLDTPQKGTGPATGWLVDRGRPVGTRVAIEAGIPVVELALQADEGSVDHYENGLAVRGPRSATRAAQDAIQDAARALLDGWLSLGVDVTPTAISALPMLRLLNSPRPEEALALATATHTDRLGATTPLRAVLPASIDRREVLPTPTGLRRLRSSEWRPALYALAGWPPGARRASTSVLGGAKRAGRILRDVRPR